MIQCDYECSHTVVIATEKLSNSEAKPRCYDNFEGDNNRVVFFWIYSVSPPPSVFYDPQLQIMRCYMARYYVLYIRKKHVRLGVIKDLCPLSWGGGGAKQNRSNFFNQHLLRSCLLCLHYNFIKLFHH